MSAETANLSQVLSDERLAVVAEFEPPARADAEAVRAAAAKLRGKVDAVGIVDNRAEIRMSAIAAAVVVRGEGVEPIVHMTVRDRNRIALMSDVLGAQALGLKNILCTTGDHQTLGREKAARNVFDLDAVQFLATLDGIRRNGTLFGPERKIGLCDFCLGATASPLADPPEMQAIRLAKKVRAGADFIITQPVFDIDHFKNWLHSLEEMDLAGKIPILPGVLAPPTAARARGINETVPGIEIPEAVIQRLESAGPDGERAAAIKIAAELIGRLKNLEGVKGICLMAEGDVSAVVEMVDQAGLKIRPEG